MGHLSLRNDLTFITFIWNRGLSKIQTRKSRPREEQTLPESQHRVPEHHPILDFTVSACLPGLLRNTVHLRGQSWNFPYVRIPDHRLTWKDAKITWPCQMQRGDGKGSQGTFSWEIFEDLVLLQIPGQEPVVNSASPFLRLLTLVIYLYRKSQPLCQCKPRNYIRMELFFKDC